MTCTRQLTSHAREPGIGEEHVDRPILVLGRPNQRLDVLLLADIGGHREAVDVAGDFCEPIAR